MQLVQEWTALREVWQTCSANGKTSIRVRPPGLDFEGSQTDAIVKHSSKFQASISNASCYMPGTCFRLYSAAVPGVSRS